MIGFQIFAVISFVIVAGGIVAFVLNRNPKASVAERGTSALSRLI